MVLAISDDVLRLATERIRSALDDKGAASSDTRWALMRTQRVAVRNK